MKEGFEGKKNGEWKKGTRATCPRVVGRERGSKVYTPWDSRDVMGTTQRKSGVGLEINK